MATVTRKILDEGRNNKQKQEQKGKKEPQQKASFKIGTPF